MPRTNGYPTAAPFLPDRFSLPQLRQAASVCQGCDLYKNATQTVFGAGPLDASAIFIGEQPGDSEDRTGKPFVGPAGRLLDELLQTAGIDRDEIYITNAVKHFKWEPRGKLRFHRKPSDSEIVACRPWLEAEISTIRPHLIVCLGATAAQSLMGPKFHITRDRGRILQTKWAPALMATIHPSALLRIPDESQRRQAKVDFIADLHVAAAELRK